jgi:TolA-binding protein
MRTLLLPLFMIAGIGAAAAQPQTNVERRVDRLEQDVRAIQRRVFPGGVPRTVDPEITTGLQQPQPVQGIDRDALTTLSARVDALEGQLARVTGQVEEYGYRVRQLEEQVAEMRAETQARLTRLEQGPPRPEPAQRPPVTPPEPEPAATDPAAADAQPARPADPAEEAYNAGYRLWQARRYEEAQQALTAAADRYPRSPWASWARNLAGRAYLDDNKPANAARIFLANYQNNPRGARAADSLFFLGEALVRLNRHAEACPVYDELVRTYPDMRDFIRSRLPAARRAARCPA